MTSFGRCVGEIGPARPAMASLRVSDECHVRYALHLGRAHRDGAAGRLPGETGRRLSRFVGFLARLQARQFVFCMRKSLEKRLRLVFSAGRSPLRVPGRQGSC